jgi:heme-degrading monooxygenase HmoA
MISRVWHGYTSSGNAEAYEALLKSEIFAGIAARGIAGYKGIQLFRRNLGEEVEFVTVMWFDSLDAVRQFAGDDYEAAVVPPEARKLLSRFDERSQHYEVRADLPAARCAELGGGAPGTGWRRSAAAAPASSRRRGRSGRT